MGIGDQEVIILPKNGVLPLGKYVRFRVKSSESQAKFIRVFLIFCREDDDLEVKKELFRVKNLEDELETQPLMEEEEAEDENCEYFDRYIKIVSHEVTLVAEFEHNHDFEILAEFQAEEYDDHYFSGIDKNWLDFVKKDYHYTEPYIKPQLTVATHPLSLTLKTDEKFQKLEKEGKFKKLKFGKFFLTPEVLVNKICQEYDKFFDQIIFLYLWITHNIEYIEKVDLLNGIVNQNPRQICKTLKGNSRSIAGLFWQCIQIMKKVSKVAESDLECLIVDGFLKEEDQIGYTKANHSWNLLKFNKFWYNIDCSKACISNSNYTKVMNFEADLQYTKALMTQEELRNLRRYFFFTKPEIFLMTHFPEEKYYSLYQDYFFTLEKFLDIPIYYPKLYVSKIIPLTKVKFNDTIRDAFKLEFKSDKFYHKFTLEKVLGNNAILQKCSFDFQDSYLYTVYLFEFDGFGNKNITICLEETIEKNRTRKQKLNFGIKSFLESSLQVLKTKKMNKIQKEEKVVNRPLINFNLQIIGENPLKNKEDYFIPPVFLRSEGPNETLNNKNSFPTTPIVEKSLSQRHLESVESTNSKTKNLKGQKRSSLGDALSIMNSQRNPFISPITPRNANHSISRGNGNNSSNSFNSQSQSARGYFPYLNHLRILSPGSYYLPEKKNILFYVYWNCREGLILDGVRGEISVQKVSENIYEFNGKFDPGYAYLRSDEGVDLVEFKVLKAEEFPDQLYGVMEIGE